MKEIDYVNDRVKGGLLEKEDAVTAFALLFEENDTDPIVFTNKELFKLFIAAKTVENFAPHENEKWETDVSNSIFNKIENYVNRIKK